MNLLCPYCHCDSEQVTGSEVYPHRADLRHKKFYRCEPCGALVGCHPGTDKPLGQLAKASLRKLRSQVHTHFDSLWQTGSYSRSRAYKQLAAELGIDPADCHIGMFGEDLCERAIQWCNRERGIE